MTGPASGQLILSGLPGDQGVAGALPPPVDAPPVDAPPVDVPPVDVPPVDDWALYAALPALVTRGGRVHVAGRLSRTAIVHAAEYARAWASFAPGSAHPVTLSADAIVDHCPSAAPGEALLALAEGQDPALPAPGGTRIRTVILAGAATAEAVRRARAAGRSVVAFTTSYGTGPGVGSPGVGDLGIGGMGVGSVMAEAAARAAAMHLLSAGAGTGLLHVPAAAAPRPGAPASPVQAAVFLSGGALDVVPLLDDGPRHAPRWTLPRHGTARWLRPVTLHVEHSVVAGATRRSVILEGLADRRPGERVTVWWEVVDEACLAAPAVLDQMVAGMALVAQERGQDLVVRGPLSRAAAIRLPLLAATRAAWGAKAPRGPIAVVPDSIVDPDPDARRIEAVISFSGGVDSVFSLLTHTGREREGNVPPVTGAVLGHGFDIPLAAPGSAEAIAALHARLAPMLARRGVRLHLVRCNARAPDLAHWHTMAMPLIAGALSQVSDRYGLGLLASGRAYPQQTVPMIQPPLLDAALTGGWFAVAMAGSAFGRMAKLARIAQDSEAVAHLRVCYQQAGRFDANCGRCAKCRRTMLQLLAAGIAEPACFAEPEPALSLAELPFGDEDEAHYAREAVAHARAHGTDDAWTDRLAERLAAWRPPPPQVPKRRAELAARVRIWGGRFAEDPLATLAFGAERAVARLKALRR